MQNIGKAVKLTMLFSIECPKDPEVVKHLFSRNEFYGVQFSVCMRLLLYLLQSQREGGATLSGASG
jgi:hypothetical protein